MITNWTILFYLVNQHISSLIYNERYSFHDSLNVLFLHVHRLKELNSTMHQVLW